jgi:hypothetical protein
MMSSTIGRSFDAKLKAGRVTEVKYRYMLQYAVGERTFPMEAFDDKAKLKTRISQLYDQYGRFLQPTVYRNGEPYLGHRRLAQWRDGLVSFS